MPTENDSRKLLICPKARFDDMLNAYHNVYSGNANVIEEGEGIPIDLMYYP